MCLDGERPVIASEGLWFSLAESGTVPQRYGRRLSAKSDNPPLSKLVYALRGKGGRAGVDGLSTLFIWRLAGHDREPLFACQLGASSCAWIGAWKGARSRGGRDIR